MAVAAQVGCRWCLDFNYFQAFHKSLDVEKASQVPRWRTSDAFSPLERDVLEYAEAMTDTPPSVTDEMVTRLSAHLGEAELVELTAIVAVENLRSRINSALGLRAQGFKDRCDIPAAGTAVAGTAGH
jgi:alkylhydroperoxidase family enzyme